MKNYNLIIGSCVSTNNKQNYLIGALNESLKNNANAMMIYMKSPLNFIRINNKQFFIFDFYQQLKKNNFDINNIIIHAPYIINLANIINNNIFEISVKLLKKEIINADEIGIKKIILHPGINTIVKKEGWGLTTYSEQIGLDRIVEGLNLVLTSDQKAKIALETMSGRRGELGTNFVQLKYIIDNVKLNNKLGICWDTCHMHDAGYRLTELLDSIIIEFDKLIGLDRLLCIHINDSKNPLNSHKDRHENIGYGYLGFETLLKIIYHPKLDGIAKILETPYVGIKKYAIAPHKDEIVMIKTKKFTDPFKKNGKIKMNLLL